MNKLLRLEIDYDLVSWTPRALQHQVLSSTIKYFTFAKPPRLTRVIDVGSIFDISAGGFVVYNRLHLFSSVSVTVPICKQ